MRREQAEALATGLGLVVVFGLMLTAPVALTYTAVRNYRRAHPHRQEPTYG